MDETALPFDSVMNGLEEFNARLDQAQGLAVQDCAEEIGITTYVPLQTTESTPVVGFGRFGLEDAEVAAESGYYVSVSESDMVGDPAADLTDEEAAALQEALTGEDAEEIVLHDEGGSEMGRLLLGDGCFSDFYEAFFGSVDQYIRFLELRQLVEQGRSNAYGTLLADEEYLALVADWESCMGESGFSVSAGFGPLALLNGPGPISTGPDVDTGDGGWPEPRPSDVEIQIATADVSCKTSTDFVSVATTLLAAHERTVADAISLSELDSELQDIYLSSGVN